MALANFSLTPLGPVAPALVTSTPAPLRISGLDDLLYFPADQPDYATDNLGPEPFQNPADNEPQKRRSKLRKRAGTAYLPPPNQFTQYPHPELQNNPYRGQLHTQVFPQNPRLDVNLENQRVLEVPRQYDNNGQYIHDPSGDYDYGQKRVNQNNAQRPYNPGYADVPLQPGTLPSSAAPPPSPPSSHRFESSFNQNHFNFGPATTSSPISTRQHNEADRKASGTNVKISSAETPNRSPGFVQVETGSAGGKTQLHAVIDYDDEYYDDDNGSESGEPRVTPLQGPILLKNGSVPVVPLTSYPTVNNGTFYQIPILWTALQVALGYELHGQVIKGTPCVKRNYQLYCPTAGNTYPLEKIETFIDENKALIKRMYGSFNTPSGSRVRRAPGVPDMHAGDSYFRHIRQASISPLPDPEANNDTGRVDSCESKIEISTPYWALNSAKKLRAIVNTMHFEQAIHQEVCTKKTTSRCSADCGCEQKYKWHRLLAYNPNDDCAGIFMDWFLFPSCCVCRCKP